MILTCLLGVDLRGDCRMTATTIIDPCVSSHAGGIVFSSPILPSLTPPLQRIIPPWCPCSSDTAQRPIWRGACQADSSDADGVLSLTWLGRHRQLAGTLPHIFLSRTQTTRTPQCPPTRRDLNGKQLSPLGPTPNAAAQKSHPVCWLIVVYGGARSEVPWAVGRRRPPWSMGAWFS